MANPNDNVSVPAVKAEPSTNAPSAPALEAANTAIKAASWLSGKTKLGLVIGGSVITLAGGTLGIKSLTSGTPKATAQQVEQKSVASNPVPKPEVNEPRKLPTEIDELPKVSAPKIKLDFDLPEVTAPKVPTVSAPKINDFEPPPLPAVNQSRTVKQDELPIIRVGAQDKPKTETAPAPKAPIIDLDIPPIVEPGKVNAPPVAPPIAPPVKLDIEIPPPPVVSPAPKVNPMPVPAPAVNLPTINPPAVSPAPKIGEFAPPPPLPGVKEEPPLVSPPTISVPPTVAPNPPTINLEPKPPVVPPINSGEPRIKAPNIDVPMTPPTINVNPGLPSVAPTPKPPVEAPKREEFDEDWHTPKPGDTYAMISKEFYKTADYSQALEAYNKDRRKGGENIVRVPPLWVLEEKFPSLVGPGKTDPRPSGTPGRTTGLTFDPVDGKTIGSSGTTRPAPAPAITPASNTNDEYRVQNESGETIREIARKIFGDANAWKRIWDMNQSIDPTQPIPVGTTLRLPR